MTILYRPARIEDIQAISDMYWRSVLETYRLHGFGYQRSEYPINPYYAFALREEPNGFFIAEDAGKVIGATISWVRGPLWFLSHLFILPEYQGLGIGKALLKRTHEYSIKEGAGIQGVITMAFNPKSVALYMTNGMYPIENIYLLHLDAGSAKNSSEPALGSSPDVLEKSSWQREDLVHIDRDVFGFIRTKHHQFFLEGHKTTGYLLRYKNKAVAYAYIWPDGRIGPMASLKEAPYKDIVKAFIGIAQKINPELTILVPGSNRIAIDVALSVGFTITLPYLLLSSRPFGDWGRYLFHSPGMM